MTPGAPDELCAQLRDLILQHKGTVREMCVDASLVLSCSLRQRGRDARLCTGNYVIEPLSYEYLEPHAYVRCGGMVYDPTREQFEDLPLVVDRNDIHYQDEVWADFDLPEHPRFVHLARRWSDQQLQGRHAWYQIYSELGLAPKGLVP
jgi:hypothetical protein